ncbi:MAG: hypothetical protein HZB19_15780 [Chloroflexi bacterium]|nr:hypothetical protein [Chloroflexota bacterium]
MEHPIETAADLYRELKRRGLHLRQENGRDNALIDNLISKLNCPSNQLQAYLDISKLSAEDFLKVFLEIVHPFALMFSLIWEFLSENCSPKALETIAVRFGFPNSPDSCTIDLEQFRRYVEMSRRVTASVPLQMWSFDAMNKLFEIGRILKQQSSIRYEYYQPGKPYKLPKPIFKQHEFDKEIEKIYGLFQTIIDEFASESAKRESRRNLPELENLDEDEDFRSLRRSAFLLTDLLPSWVRIFGQYETVPVTQKEEALKFFKKEIRPFLETQSKNIAVPVSEALDILDLPFWRHRWHTYEVWATILIMKLLEDYQPVLRIKSGYIPIDGYTESVIASLSAENYDRACVALQVQTPFEKNKRKAIKPDLRICFSGEFVSENTAVIVEFKQLSSPKKSVLEEIAKSYSEGSPDCGGVIIINYDETNLNPLFPKDCFFVEGVEPQNQKALLLFEKCLKNALSNAKLLPISRSAMVLLDVSSSMGNAYEARDVQLALRRILGLGWVKVFRFNNGLVPGGDLDEADYRDIRTFGDTQLGKAILQIEEISALPTKLLIVTDGGHEHPVEILKRMPNVRECNPDELEENFDWLLRP